MVMFCFDFLFCFLTSKYTEKNIGKKENPAKKRKRLEIKIFTTNRLFSVRKQFLCRESDSL